MIYDLYLDIEECDDVKPQEWHMRPPVAMLASPLILRGEGVPPKCRLCWISPMLFAVSFHHKCVINN